MEVTFLAIIQDWKGLICPCFLIAMVIPTWDMLLKNMIHPTGVFSTKIQMELEKPRV